MKLVFHIPCFCIHGDKVLACDNHDFRRELLEGLEGDGHLYSFHVKSFILGNLFPCEHLVFHVDDESFYKYVNIFHELVCKYHSVLGQDVYIYEHGDILVRLKVGGGIADRHWESFVGRVVSNPATDILFHSYDNGKFTVRHYSGNPDEYLEFVGTPEEVAEEFGFSDDMRKKFFNMN